MLTISNPNTNIEENVNFNLVIMIAKGGDWVSKWEKTSEEEKKKMRLHKSLCKPHSSSLGTQN